MSLLQNWRDIAYNQEADKKQLQQFWTNYFLIEKNIYEQLLSNPDEVVKGTVKELAEKYKVDVMTMVGFLDGINDSLVIPNPIEEMEEDTVVTLAYDKELLYKNMVDAKADWLYNLPMWDEIFTEEQKKTLYMEQKKSGTSGCHCTATICPLRLSIASMVPSGAVAETTMSSPGVRTA